MSPISVAARGFGKQLLLQASPGLSEGAWLRSPWLLRLPSSQRGDWREAQEVWEASGDSLLMKRMHKPPELPWPIRGRPARVLQADSCSAGTGRGRHCSRVDG